MLILAADQRASAVLKRLNEQHQRTKQAVSAVVGMWARDIMDIYF